MLRTKSETTLRETATDDGLVSPEKALRPARGLIVGFLISGAIWSGLMAWWLW